jgi:CBS domain containing-hemolysin-like protein
MGAIVPLVILLGSIAGYALFVLFKISVSRSSTATLERAVEDGVWGAKLATQILEDADSHILSSHAGRFVSALGCGVGALAVFACCGTSLAERLDFVPPLLVNVVFGLVITFVISLAAIVAAQFAAAIASRYPERVLLNLGWACFALMLLSFPLRVAVDWMVSLLEQIARVQRAPSEREITYSAEDLETVIEHSTQAGILDDNESELLQGALRLSEITISEIMTPRADIAFISLESDLDTLCEVFQEAGFSRVLIVGDDLDDVRGMVLAKDLIPLMGQEVQRFTIEGILREVLFVDGDLPGDDTLRRLRASQAHLAVVLDEHGGVDGIITLEDLLEEIVGDIFDETDVLEEEREVTVMKSGELLVDGGTSLADLESDHDIELPEGEYDTVAGFVIHQLGCIPEAGAEVRWNGSRLLVEEVDENRITQLRIVPAPDDEHGDPSRDTAENRTGSL